MKYNLDWVKKLYDFEEPIKFLFFWGHQPGKDGRIKKSCFSQWYDSPFKVDGISYKTAEHWMMAEKARLFQDNLMEQKIIVANTPGEAKKLGRQVGGFIQEVWEANRYEIVKRGNIYKFEQNPALLKFLLNTNNRILVEASPYDKIWGIGKTETDQEVNNPYNWDGLNLLGFALMEVRDELGEKEG